MVHLRKYLNPRVLKKTETSLLVKKEKKPIININNNKTLDSFLGTQSSSQTKKRKSDYAPSTLVVKKAVSNEVIVLDDEGESANSIKKYFKPNKQEEITILDDDLFECPMCFKKFTQSAINSHVNEHFS